MSHYTEGVLQAYLDNEVAADTRAQIAAHVNGCVACAARLQELRELGLNFTAAVQGVDVAPIPSAALAELRVRAQRWSLTNQWAGSRKALLRAAMLVLGITAVAAATVPGSPIRGWLVQAWRSVRAEQAVETAPVTPQVVPSPVAEEPTPLRIAPENDRIRIRLQSPAEGTRIHVVLIDEDRAAVEATGRRFRTQPGLMEITGSSGNVRISLPRAVGEASVEVDGRLYVSKEGRDLRFHGPSADTVGTELIFRPGR